jgi:hypothetical protein
MLAFYVFRSRLKILFPMNISCDDVYSPLCLKAHPSCFIRLVSGHLDLILGQSPLKGINIVEELLFALFIDPFEPSVSAILSY